MTVRARSIVITAACLAVLIAPLLIGARFGHLAEAARGLPQTAAFLLSGTLALLTSPRHRGARRLLAVGVVMAVGYVVGSAYSGHLAGGGSASWQVVLLLQALEIGQALALLALLAVFPDGRYRMARDRVVVRTAAVLGAAVVLAARIGSATVTYPGSLIWGDHVTAPNPTVPPALAWLGRVAAGGYGAAFPVCVGTGLVLRFRSAEPAERRKIRWLVMGALVTLIVGVTLGAAGGWVHTLPTWLVYVLYSPAAFALPLAIGLGMVRDNVLDVDAVIRRSVAYAVLWVLAGGICVGAALGLGLAAGASLPLPMAIGLTVAATLLLAPLRTRLERLADRLVHGRRLSGYELIAQLGARLEATPAQDAVAPEVAAAVRAGVGATWVRVVVDNQAGGTVLGSAGQVPDSAGPAIAVPLVQAGVVVGSIECGPKRDGRYRDADRQLLASLGRQAALAVHNDWLARQVEARVVDLDASRARLVAAEDASRRRLERDLHDGVQQDLVALLARIGLARNQLRRDPLLADASLKEVALDGQRALLAVQEVSRGLHPPLLSDRGLVEAVSERAARMPIPVDVRSNLNGRARFSRDVEHAAYFAISEAMTNIAKHASASRAVVTIGMVEDDLVVDVSDDGCGFDVANTPRRGLLGLADRIDALGGQITVRSAPGRGSTLSFTVPEGPRT
ncbi:ATP-binding protein [Kribbella sp. GL6]|uniref:ATP-binding protein n=1 Tax=Kribbella sp. GL6 TaxID=3419765 RepID=UPI003D02A9D7